MAIDWIQGVTEIRDLWTLELRGYVVRGTKYSFPTVYVSAHDVNNPDYQDVQEWINAGNTPDTNVTLDTYRQILQHRVYNLRQDKEVEGLIIVALDGTRYNLDTSLKGRANLQGVVNAYLTGIFSDTDTVNWKFMGAQYKTLNKDQVIEMGAFMLDYIEKLFQAEGTHCYYIGNLQSIEDAINYDVEGQFWPPKEYNSTLI